MNKTRVLILGGGCGGLAAAWQLTCTPERRNAFDVTVVQSGWRLGGKGATGRDPDHGQRIHEHGLHVWMGFYQNAFSLAHAAYEAWDPPPNSALQTIEDAFSPHYTTSMFDVEGRVMEMNLPPRPGRPWDRSFQPVSTGKEFVRWVANEGLHNLLATLGNLGTVTDNARNLRRLGAVIARGLMRDVVVGDGWDSLDEYDLCEWLRHHGAEDPAVWDAPPIRAFYNLAFAYPDGHSGFGRGELSAGAALRSLFRMMLTYRGAPMWKMNAGMGDTVFVPLYEALRDRGVAFEFFSRVQSLETDGADVTGVIIDRQATPRQERYEPLVELNEPLHLRVWPDRPVYERLTEWVDGDLEADTGPALRTDRYVRGEDFDVVVLAIPVPAHRYVARHLIEASPRYREMVDNHQSVVTVAAQIWTRQDLPSLGWGDVPTVCVNGPGVFSSWADMSEVLAFEGWPTDDAPRTALYFVDTAPDEWFEGMDRAAAAAEVSNIAAGDFEARADSFPSLHQLELCCDADVEKGIESQYFRANIGLSERYVLSPPGSIKHRLAPDDSTFGNLWLAGDWTRSSINGGSVEGAAESGRTAGETLAARFGFGDGTLANAPI